MQIEKLNENKIRIILNLKDLEENNIDLHSFMASSIESQDLFYNMLDKAEREIGFETKNYKLMIEAIATTTGNFILTVTRFMPDKEQTKIPKAKRKLTTPLSCAIYSFNSFDDYLELCRYLHTCILDGSYTGFKNTTLYKYNSKYYLCISFSKNSLKKFKSLHCSIIEFGTYISNSDLFKSKLLEYATPIFETNAIKRTVEYFICKKN